MSKLAAIVVGVPLAILVFYSFRIVTPVGLMAGVCISGGLSYAFIKPYKGHAIALAGSIAIILVVMLLSTLLMVNLLAPPDPGDYAFDKNFQRPEKFAEEIRASASAARPPDDSGSKSAPPGGASAGTSSGVGNGDSPSGDKPAPHPAVPKSFLLGWQPKADSGDAEAQFNVGYYYLRSKDYAQAAAWYRKAADQGYVGAQVQLGQLYLYGDGVPPDPVEGVKWLRKAAEQGDPSVARVYPLMGRIYGPGLGPKHGGIIQNWVESYFWYSLGTMISDTGVDDPNRNVAGQHLTSRQFEEVDTRIQQWNPNPSPYFLAEIKQKEGVMEKQSFLTDAERGPDYLTLEASIGRGSYAKADDWFLKAADEGGLEEQYRIGFMYMFGLGVGKNYGEAMKWLRKAADQGNAQAQFWVEDMYTKSRGVQEDDQEAFFWRTIARKSDPRIKADDTLESRITAEQKAAVDKRVAEWTTAPTSSNAAKP
jgi:hypothetical protein